MDNLKEGKQGGKEAAIHRQIIHDAGKSAKGCQTTEALKFKGGDSLTLLVREYLPEGSL